MAFFAFLACGALKPGSGESAGRCRLSPEELVRRDVQCQIKLYYIPVRGKECSAEEEEVVSLVGAVDTELGPAAAAAVVVVDVDTELDEGPTGEPDEALDAS